MAAAVAIQFFDAQVQAGRGVDVVAGRELIRAHPALGTELTALRGTLGLLVFGEEREEILEAWADMPDGFASAARQVIHPTGLAKDLLRPDRIAEVVSPSDLDGFEGEIAA